MPNSKASGLSVLKPDGHLITYDESGAEIAQADTVQCCHCDRQWILGRAIEEAIKGKMGFCQKCNGIHCPRPECEHCIPIERWLDLKDKGIDTFGMSELELSFLPVSVPCRGVPGKE